MDDKTRVIAAFFVALVVGFLTGYYFGFQQTSELCIKVAERLLNVTFNDHAYAQILQRYPEILQIVKLN